MRGVYAQGMTELRINEVDEFFRACDRSPVRLNKEIPGHIGNRLQAAVWREAISLVARGVATVADVDIALHEGPGVRWALLGMHAIFDLGGGAGGCESFSQPVHCVPHASSGTVH